MISRGREQIPAFLCLAAVLYGWSIHSLLTVLADEPANDKSTNNRLGGLSISDFIYSLYNDESGPVSSDKPEEQTNNRLRKEELASFLNEWVQKHQQGEESSGEYSGEGTNFGNNYQNGRRKRKSNRRRVLYELSVQAHYEETLRNNYFSNKNESQPTAYDESDGFPTSGMEEKSTDSCPSCEFYNEYLYGKEYGKDQENAILFSQFSYWSYKLCQGKSISQFHLEATPISSESEQNGQAKISGELQIDPSNKVDANIPIFDELSPNSKYLGKALFHLHTIHNLGAFLHPSNPEYKSLVTSAWGVSEGNKPIPHEDVDYYINGDSCTYTPEESESQFPEVTTRQSKVIYADECCKRTEGTVEEFFRQDHTIKILSVTEPVPCRYVFLTCRYCLENDATLEDNGVPSKSPSQTTMTADPLEISNLLKTYLHTSPSDDEDLFSHFPPMPPSQIEANKKLLRDMFTHAFDSYIYNAFPASELHPVTCQPGEFHLVRLPALTLIDTLDTLIIMGNFTEFARSVERLRYLDVEMKREFNETSSKSGKNKKREGEEGGLFAVNQAVSVFETTIRVLGGLLSAHQLAEAFMKNKVTVSEVWDPYGEILLGNSTVKDSPQILDGKEGNEGEGSSIVDGTCSNPVAGDVPTPLPEPSPHPSSELDECIFEECTSDVIPDKTKEKVNNSTFTGNMTHWTYDGFLLSLAHDIGNRLLYAFETDTGIPYGTVNLLYGVPKDETPVASLAGAGTLTLEFELLSRLTGNDSFGGAAKLATRALWTRRELELDLFGKHINTKNGKWTEYLSGIGSNSDSFYEYLIKHYLLFPDDVDFWLMFVVVYAGVWNNSRLGDWYVDVDMNHGLNGHVRQIFESLMAFYPGMQVLLGELSPSAKTLNSFFLVREFLGLLPERFNFVHWKTEGGGDIHPLRPELLESCYFLHLATIGLQGKQCGPCSHAGSSQHSSSWLWAADFALHTVNKLSWTPCGFATVKNVAHTTTGSIGGDFVKVNNDPQHEQRRLKIKHHDEMPSYFLSETIKYLYLTFDAEDNLLHKDSERDWIFTTEAHPIHNVPKPNPSVTHVGSSTSLEGDSTDTDHLTWQMEKVRTLLRSKHPKGESAGNEFEVNVSQYLETEQWAQNTPVLEFSKDINDVESGISFNKQGQDEMKGAPFRRGFHLNNVTSQQGIFSSEIMSSNLAHDKLDYQGKGSGIMLGKCCPNIHHPDLIWTHALHGTLEYKNSHSSSISNVPNAIEGTDARTLTALASVCFYGTDYQSDGIAADPTRSCHVEEDPGRNIPPSNRLQRSTSAPIPGSTRYDMGGDLGRFDVSAFANGDGFIVRHVNSDELLEVSIFYDFEVSDGDISMSQDAIILAILTVTNTPGDGDVPSYPQPDVVASSLSSWKSSGERWKSLTGGRIAGNPHAGEGAPGAHRQKHVIVADMNSHSYSCSIVLAKVGGDGSPLARFPCSPALFGKARIDSLVENGGVIINGSLRAPPQNDELGCDGPGNDSEFNLDNFCEAKASSTVQMVKRGSCNFLRKAKHQLIQRGANAVIVINSEPHELFVMANEIPPAQTNGPCTSEDAPVSVLVSKNDGDAIIQLLMDEETNGNDVDVSVELIEQDLNSGDLPQVKGTEEALQIFAKNGWGVHAVRQGSDESGKNNDGGISSAWQLFIMQHSKKS